MRTFKYALFAAFLMICGFLSFGGSARAATDASISGTCITYVFPNGMTYVAGSDIIRTMLITDPSGMPAVDGLGNYVIDPGKAGQFFSGLEFICMTSPEAMAASLASGQDLTAQHINVAEEAAFLIAAADTAYRGDRPVSLQSGRTASAPVLIGAGTMIDIDIDSQTLTYYVDGIPVLQTPVVTGNVRGGCSTPRGNYTVRNKATNVTLVGRGYASFVKYWVPIVGNSIGIHDANWRSSFGGDIYRTNGSHGCINVPPSTMEQFYPMIEVGTPVHVH